MVEDRTPTRQTLLLRLRDKADDRSWAEFAEIYTPLLYGYCQKREISHSDSADIVQEVMRSVSIAMARFEYDPERGRFRSWLFTAVRNAVSSHFGKQSRRPMAIAQTELINLMAADPGDLEQDEWERDYQRQLLAWAMEKIGGEFAPRVWRAFEGTALQGDKAKVVSEELGMSVNAVTVAKHRVLKRLKEKVQSIDADRWEEEMIARRD